MTIIGIDPGARTTGIIATTTTGEILAHDLITNPGDLLPVPPAYLAAVNTAIAAYTAAHGPATLRVESITRPNWHVQKKAKRGAASNPEALIGTAMVLGAVLAIHPDAELIQPKNNGGNPLACYPTELVGPRERAKPGWEQRVGTGQLRHARSAYDIARGPHPWQTPPRNTSGTQ